MLWREGNAVIGLRNMKKKIIISTTVAFFISFVFGPADPISQIMLGLESAFFCCVVLLILSIFKFVKSSSNSMHTLISILVCMVSVLYVQWLPWLRFQERSANCINGSPNSSFLSSVSSSRSSRIGNLWIMYLSNQGGILSKDTESVICSVDSPKTHSFDGSTMIFTFADGNSVKVRTKNHETIWIDKEHKMMYLGLVLNKEDVSLLCNQSYDKELKISSPEELVNVISKLKTENPILGHENGPD
jgi:hypothetical protein